MTKQTQSPTAQVSQTTCKFCLETVPVESFNGQSGLHRGEQFLLAHADQYGGPCVQGSGLLVQDNAKPLVALAPPEPFDPKRPYKHTLNLPQTDFPMRRACNESELALLKFWGL